MRLCWVVHDAVPPVLPDLSGTRAVGQVRMTGDLRKGSPKRGRDGVPRGVLAVPTPHRKPRQRHPGHGTGQRYSRHPTPFPASGSTRTAILDYPSDK
jgi:hypothetical protein